MDKLDDEWINKRQLHLFVFLFVGACFARPKINIPLAIVLFGMEDVLVSAYLFGVNAAAHCHPQVCTKMLNNCYKNLWQS